MNPGALRRSASSLSEDAGGGARRSHGLESLNTYLSSRSGLHILDLGGINQANLDFITGKGHRLYSEDLLRTFDSFFSAEEHDSQTYTGPRLDAFLDEVLSFPNQSTNGCLVWDILQFLPDVVAQAVLERLHRILAPDSVLLALFQPETGSPTATANACRIVEGPALQMKPRGAPRPIQRFNARAIERFFQRFNAVKFFMTRNSLQEVVVRR